MTRFTEQSSGITQPLGAVSRRYLADEAELVAELAAAADPGEEARKRILATADSLVRAVRKQSVNEGGIDAFLQQYDLSSQEGVLLMCVAEALLRIPDADTADKLIADKITAARWEDYLGVSDSLFVNASTWGLMLTGQMLKLDDEARSNPARYLGKFASSAGEPVVRGAMRQAMRIMGHQFVMGRDIDEALKRSQKGENTAYRYSFDMLGEAALTKKDAARYFESYRQAIEKLGKANTADSIFSAPSISVKLSALHPRYEFTQHQRVMDELVPLVTELALTARKSKMALTVDAEEADRLELSLDVFAAAFKNQRLADYHGLGLAVQAYQRRASDVLSFVAGLAAQQGRRIPVRLVKGAYWDTEIKRAQEQGLASYPVFTRKSHTDVSYLACARQMLAAADEIYPQFATHNARTLASILQYAGSRSDLEFQRLHGMGEELYEEVIDPEKFDRPCRVYAPVGSHEDLLPYLVRRLLENGANTSFVNRIVDEAVPIEDIIADPIELSRQKKFAAHSQIPAPAALFGAKRRNSQGQNLADRGASAALLKALDVAEQTSLNASPIVGGKALQGEASPSVNPANNRDTVGTCVQADKAGVDRALELASQAHTMWDATPAAERAAILERAADLFESNTADLLALCVREAGKTIPDAIAELREAVDFLRYYAQETRRLFATTQTLPGPTGESNELGMRGRGVFVCISPWNFPLAIFTGQVAAALAAGNTVLAKPAEQTPLVAYRAVQLLHEAGVPANVLHFLPGDGATVGGHAVADSRVAGVAFTGSTDTARIINRTLAGRDGPIPVLIAETGGQNALFVDSSALPEQVVVDCVTSAFNAAGQRCSALRILCVQEDVAPRVISLLEGAMRELVIGDPGSLATDVGPVIDDDARQGLQQHVDSMATTAQTIYQCALPASTANGHYFAPIAMEIDGIDVLEREVFGPVLHVLRYRRRKLAETIAAVNATGFGLTMGLHSRISARTREFVKLSGAGNIYINRNMIGAIVGSQPFGGRGLSGTGPKAGGPHYLARFGSEYAVSNNVAAVGGNASLLSLTDS
ncbi:MAG: bifunctional proline dehydrogenase/L-glutamate gamma-semialdehyde dehydrogenase PutA [Woeseia sp.]|nr:bifunctional proline dehydrogenase/L-glutamate gamma-semialdehyde dehydrogenase PutA [Woeseia sp.]NNE59474.1 bifunctional proline dehydrogenase/L-glutamate gamma-semialdehyde dehydrogenase PutA [Woeseia sp.]